MWQPDIESLKQLAELLSHSQSKDNAKHREIFEVNIDPKPLNLFSMLHNSPTTPNFLAILCISSPLRMIPTLEP